jgi:hypothetical protein
MKTFDADSYLNFQVSLFHLATILESFAKPNSDRPQTTPVHVKSQTERPQ